MVKLALAFGSAEYFALMVLAFVMVTTMLGASRLRGWLSLLLGLTLGFVGIDALSGQARFTFGIPYLLDGIDPVIVAIGLFAIGETLWIASRGPAIDEVLPVRGSLWMTAEEWRRSWKPWLRGTAIGFPLGALPAGGAELPTLMSYAIEKRLSKRPQEFGRGAIEAVAGPEAANNASAAGTLVPLLTLGLPTSATAAVLLAAFQQFGLQPGPAAVRARAGAGVGRDRQPLHRQRDAAGAQPAAGRPVGQAAVDSAALALRRHPRRRIARRLQRASLGRRPGADGRRSA